MTTFEARVYIPSSTTDERFIRHFSSEKKDVLNQYKTECIYGTLFTPLNRDWYDHKFSEKALCSDTSSGDSASALTVDDWNLPPFEVKDKLSDYIFIHNLLTGRVLRK
jgi:hypothetical protein